MKGYNDDMAEYAERCRREIMEFLEGDFINTDPVEADDAQLILDADIRSRRYTFEGSSYLSRTRQFCSLMVVDGEETKLYNPDRYVECLALHPMNYTGKERVLIPFNHFQYPMMPDKGTGEKYREEEAKLVCTLDSLHDKEEILSSGIKLVLMAHYVGGITVFNQTRNVYRLVSVSPQTLADTLRRELTRARQVVMAYLTRYPGFCRPSVQGLVINEEDAACIMAQCVQEMHLQINEKKRELKL